jgi:hypothetical protein
MVSCAPASRYDAPEVMLGFPSKIARRSTTIMVVGACPKVNHALRRPSPAPLAAEPAAPSSRDA